MSYQLPTKEELADRLWWRRGSTRLAWFNSMVMPYAWDEKFQDFGIIHQLMCDHLDPTMNPAMKKSLSAFRGSHKTTQILGFLCWFFCWNLAKRNTNAAVYNTATKDNAFNMQSDMKHSLLHNDKLLWIFPEVPRDEASYDSMTQKRIEHRHVRIDFSSLETTMVSRHYPCLCEGQLVYTSNGLEPIENVKKSARVMNRFGRHTEVLAIKKSPVSEPVREITICGQPETLRATASHPILVYKNNSIEWNHAATVKPGDLVAMPIPTGLTRTVSRTNKKINSLMTSRAFWRFLGYWIAEGCASDGNRVRLTFGKNESHYAEEVQRTITDLCGKPVNIHRTKSSTIMVDFSDPDVKEILGKFGTHSWNKHIPPVILSANESLQREFLIGYFRGDGSKILSTKGWKYRGWTATSVSRSLLAGIQILLANSGIPSSIRLSCARGKSKILGNECSTRNTYILSASSVLMDVLMGSPAEFPPKPNRIKIIPGYILFPVLSNEEIEYRGDVYDIQVRDGESFVVPGVAVHNCWINDDLENNENSKTEYMREELKKTWKYQKAILTKIKSRGIGMEIEVGTPYHTNGLTWQILQNPSYSKLMIPCYKNRDIKQGVTFPELYTVEDFEDKFRDMGTTIASSQYLLLPLSEEDALCPEHWIKRWTRLPDVRWRSMVIDPALSASSGADATGITIVDTDENGVLYIVHAEEYFLTPDKLIDCIVNLKNQFDPDDVRIEKEKYSLTIADTWQHRYPEMNISYVEHKGRRKGWGRGVSANFEDSRIWRLKQWFETKRILLGPNMPSFEKQLIEYPDSVRDDMLDSLAYQLDIRRIPKRKGKMILPSGKEFDPQIEPSFEREMDEIMERKIRQQEERFGDSAF